MIRWPWRKRHPQAPAPAPSPGQAPANPGAGEAAGPPVTETATPAPGLHLYGREVMTTHFFDTGITVTIDHQRMRGFVDIPPADEWDGLRRFLEDTAP